MNHRTWIAIAAFAAGLSRAGAQTADPGTVEDFDKICRAHTLSGAAKEKDVTKRPAIVDHWLGANVTSPKAREALSLVGPSPPSQGRTEEMAGAATEAGHVGACPLVWMQDGYGRKAKKGPIPDAYRRICNAQKLSGASKEKELARRRSMVRDWMVAHVKAIDPELLLFNLSKRDSGATGLERRAEETRYEARDAGYLGPCPLEWIHEMVD